MNPRNKVIYVAGPYTPWNVGEYLSSSIDNNIEIARQFAIRLWQKGFTVICPHLNTAHFEQDCPCKYDDYLQGDLELLSRCDAIFMLPNWEYSTGAKMEYEFVKNSKLDITGFLMPGSGLIEFKHPIKILRNLDDVKNWKKELTDDSQTTE